MEKLLKLTKKNGETILIGVESIIKVEAVYNACVEFIQWYNQNEN